MFDMNELIKFAAKANFDLSPKNYFIYVNYFDTNCRENSQHGSLLGCYLLHISTPTDIFEDVNNEIPEENEEENVRNDVRILNDVHISNDVQIDGNGQKRKNPEISSSHFKTGRKKSSKQIGGAARLSSQIEKLCNAADNMSQAISSLTPVMDPYGIP
ncbi:hypothetical protein PVK06_034309 [Gossypium arboreum]|uniref:Uncharacterized protein n=1 Tax=Gossypium arboreum TaxID=29729 RepID=A0ABR0NFY9_GOSAR|nr:hypothetical protein PVK06_034309 [Gossypium arboreum]